MSKAAVTRAHASDGERDFVVETYTYEKQHRARISVLLGHDTHSAVGVGDTAADAVFAAWAAFQEKFDHGQD